MGEKKPAQEAQDCAFLSLYNWKFRRVSKWQSEAGGNSEGAMIVSIDCCWE